MDTKAGAKTGRVTKFPSERIIRRKEFDDLKTKVDNLETVVNDIAEIKVALFKIARYIKVAIPSVISAALAAGMVDGRMGKFLVALFGSG